MIQDDLDMLIDDLDYRPTGLRPYCRSWSGPVTLYTKDQGSFPSPGAWQEPHQPIPPVKGPLNGYHHGPNSSHTTQLQPHPIMNHDLRGSPNSLGTQNQSIKSRSVCSFNEETPMQGYTIMKDQGYMIPPKETNKAPITVPKEMEILQLLEKEFKIIMFFF